MTDQKQLVKEIKEIETKVDIAQTNIHKLRRKLENLKLKKELPALEKEYNDTYWVYENGYSREDRWPLYYHCIKVISVGEAIANCFEIKAHSGNDFEVNKSTYLSSFQTKITKAKYLTAKKRFLKLAQLL